MNDVIASSQVPANLAQLQALELRSEAAAKFHRFDDGNNLAETEKPNFLTNLRGLEKIREGQRAHFEAKLEPITDPHLQVEWLKDGEPVIVGHRFRPIHDFGYVALDIIDTISEDSGIYTCRATNLNGSAEIQAPLNCQSTRHHCFF